MCCIPCLSDEQALPSAFTIIVGPGMGGRELRMLQEFGFTGFRAMEVQPAVAYHITLVFHFSRKVRGGLLAEEAECWVLGVWLLEEGVDVYEDSSLIAMTCALL
ncbi:hypothetical protein BKA70DRAFT_1238160 [Coprinopsis sp. MPI-PUGE-AT-0042]|nr:hypothetical protein BKA70DRAFT_1238160 [Coprinopsis sp. MPI-PUGE-AT-0042]